VYSFAKYFSNDLGGVSLNISQMILAVFRKKVQYFAINDLVII